MPTSLCNAAEEPPDRERHGKFFRGKVNINNPKGSWINAHSVGECIKSFRPYKVAGPDALCPIVFKLLGPRMLHRLALIIRANYLLGGMPDCWRVIRVIFSQSPTSPITMFLMPSDPFH